MSPQTESTYYDSKHLLRSLKILQGDFLNYFLGQLYIVKYIGQHSEHLHLARDTSCKNQVSEILYG